MSVRACKCLTAYENENVVNYYDNNNNVNIINGRINRAIFFPPHIFDVKLRKFIKGNLIFQALS